MGEAVWGVMASVLIGVTVTAAFFGGLYLLAELIG